MTIQHLQEEILRLKTEQDVCILAHSYQAQEILEIADFTGDSFQLSMQAAKAPQSTMLLCGVRFMAETVKILSPEKRVLLANPAAGCPMAEQLDKPLLEQVRKRYPDHTVVAYINTTAELKTLCDVCVTSSSAVEIVRKLPDKRILFIPDCNLGDYVAKQVPEKEIKLLSGGCPIHARVSAEDVARARAEHPGPRCWCIRNACRRCWNRQTLSALPPPSCSMPQNPTAKPLLLAPRSALCSICPMNARKSASIPCPRT